MSCIRSFIGHTDQSTVTVPEWFKGTDLNLFVRYLLASAAQVRVLSVTDFFSFYFCPFSLGLTQLSTISFLLPVSVHDIGHSDDNAPKIKIMSSQVRPPDVLVGTHSEVAATSSNHYDSAFLCFPGNDPMSFLQLSR